MAKEYVEERSGGYYLAGTRISLDSIVQCFNEGLSPETIVGEFETLTLTQVFGAITFYLESQPAVDAYRVRQIQRFDATRRNAEPLPGNLRDRLVAAREQLHFGHAEQVKPRFQADNDLRNSIRTGVLRHEPSVDFQSALAARLDGIPDPEVLRLSMVQGRILVSHDENSMPGHFNDFLRSGNRCPGVLLVPQGAPVGRVIESLLLVWIASDAAEWVDRIAWLPI